MWQILFLILAIALAVVLVIHVFRRGSAWNGFSIVIAMVFFGLLGQGHIGRLDFSASPGSLQATLVRAEETVDAARTLMLSYGKVLFGIVADADLASLNADKYARRDAIKELVIKEAERARLSEKEIREISDVEKPSISSIYAEAVYWYGGHYLNGVGPEATKFDTAMQSVLGHHPTPDELEKIVKEAGIDDPVTLAFIDDYRYYVKTGKHRRPEVWHKRSEWLGRYRLIREGWP